jgi:D-glycero-alpha-D-manno-heptose-7-phosphate kinase
MIITRSPFRITLGGGGTDLKSYYSKKGGFIFSFAIDKYMYITVNKPVIDKLIRIKYSESETVENVKYIKHEIAKSCLQKMKIKDSIEIVSMADIPSGTGFGSSSCYTVGLLNALHIYKRDFISLNDLAEEACEIEIKRLKKPIGKQDQYITTFGGFTVLEIAKNGYTEVRKAKIKKSTINELRRNLLIFYTGKTRSNEKILSEQFNKAKNNDKTVMKSLDYIKSSGYEILKMFETGYIDDLGAMFHEHWKYKKKLV